MIGLILSNLLWSNLLWANEVSNPDVLSPNTKLLLAVQTGQIPGPFADRVSEDHISVTVRFSVPPTSYEIAMWEQQDLVFSRRKGELISIGDIYTVRVPWTKLSDFAADPNTVRIDLAKPLHVRKPLDVSVLETQAQLTNDTLGGGEGAHLTGKGIVVANFDTGIDITHPDFFRANGGVYDWIDSDADGVFTPGIDGVDLDADGTLSATEVLQVHQADITIHADTMYYGSLSTFEADLDWLFVDSNGDGMRNAGLDEGFSDSDFAFGEPVFIVEDRNHNASLDIGERILGLGTSKIIASLDGNDSEWW